MKILRRVEKFPGGLVVIPLMITALINTLCPKLLQIGGVTTALFKEGTFTILGLLLFFSGCQLRLSNMTMAVRRGGVMILVKILVAFIFGLFIMKIWGPSGFLGVSAVAMVTAVSSNNPAVYLALVKKYGDETDASVFGFLCLSSMPLLPLTVLGVSGGAFNMMEIVTLLVPFVLGILLANLDEDIARMMEPGTVLMLPFIGFCFGASVNLLDAFREVGGGVLLLLLYTVVTVIPQVAADRLLLDRPGYAAIASCTIGGTALVVPAIVANSMPVHSVFVETAVAQLAFAVTFSCLLTPLLSGLWGKWLGYKNRSKTKLLKLNES